MISTTYAGSRFLAAAALATCLGCGDNLTLPGDRSTNFQLTIVGGNQQTGTVGQELPQPLAVRLLGDGDLPLSGRRVAFVSPDRANARFDPDTALTDSDGVAEASWILGTAPGAYEAEARVILPEVTEPPVAMFDAAAVAADPDSVRPLSPFSQPGRMNQPLPEPLVVMVVDRFGNPVAGAEVEWDVSAGKGEVSESETATGADGKASVMWTLGDRVGVHVLTAKVKEGHVFGSPVTFTATVLF
jgi:Bacterial Ig-like domain (group 1)